MIAPLDPFSEVVNERRRWWTDWYSWFAQLATLVTSLETTVLLLQNTFATSSTTVAGLPTAGTKGRRYFVTDATATAFATVVAGGGANNVPVYDDGTNWRIG